VALDIRGGVDSGFACGLPGPMSFATAT
jgi:hypothetical protein